MKNFFFFLWRLILVAIRQNESDILVVALNNKFFKTSSVDWVKALFALVLSRFSSHQTRLILGRLIKSKYSGALSPGRTKIGLKKAGLAKST